MDVISFKEARDAKEQVKELQLSTSKRIGDLETKVSAYEGANLHAETLITEESYADANHLPKNAAESVMKVGLEGLTATNLIENGDFSNGTTGWTALDTEDFIASEKEASFTATSQFGAIVSSLPHFTSGHKYFIRAVVKTDSSNVTVSLSHKPGYTAGKYSLSGTGAFETAYFTATLPEDTVLVRVQIMDYRTSDWTPIHVKEVLAIDLTAHGLENYTADEVNTMVANWFDATIHTAGSCRVRSVDVGGETVSTLYFNAGQPLRSLPNGVADEMRDGELVQRVSDEVVLVGATSEHWVRRTDIDSKYTDIAVFEYQSGIMIPINNVYVFPHIFPLAGKYGEYECISTTVHNGQLLPKVCIEKSRLTTVSVPGFKAWLQQNPITLFYQLAELIIHPVETFGTVYSRPAGTLYKEPVHGSVHFYEDGITVEGLTFSGIDYVAHVDKDTGLYTDITDTCALTAEKNGFTSTALTNGDLVWYELIIDSETTTSGKLIYSYYDSRYAVVDDADGKIYRWTVKSTNGVPRLELVEV